MINNFYVENIKFQIEKKNYGTPIICWKIWNIQISIDFLHVADIFQNINTSMKYKIFI